MSTNQVQEVTIIPLPDNNQMTSDNPTISGIADNGIVKYTPNGKYEITASSFSFGKNPYNACNDDDNYWECNKQMAGSSDYGRDPYNKSQIGNSPYLGGDTSGSGDNTFTTSIGVSGSKRTAQVRGEWIQVHIPYKAYLQNYRIETPNETYSTFPTKFVLVGSNDGTEWTQLDQRNLPLSDLTVNNNIVTQKMFDINTTDKYSYFRLIVNGMGPKMSTIRINKFRLVGTTMISSNPNVETFVTLTRSIEINNEVNNNTSYDGINMFDKQYAIYDTPTTSLPTNKPTTSLPTNNIQRHPNQTQNKQMIDYLTQTNIIAGAVLTSAFIYTLIHK